MHGLVTLLPHRMPMRSPRWTVRAESLRRFGRRQGHKGGHGAHDGRRRRSSDWRHDHWRHHGRSRCECNGGGAIIMPPTRSLVQGGGSPLAQHLIVVEDLLLRLCRRRRLKLTSTLDRGDRGDARLGLACCKTGEGSRSVPPNLAPLVTQSIGSSVLFAEKITF